MKAKTRCILSIILTVLPIVPLLASFIGYIPNLPLQVAAFFAQYVSLAFLGEWGVYCYPCYAILVAILACGMYSFSDSTFSKKQERLLLGFPIVGSIFGLLNLMLLLSVGGAAYLPLTVCEILAFIGWLVCNLRAVCRRTDSKNVFES